jgi:hypothetical protein
MIRVSQLFPYSLTSKLIEFGMLSGEAIKEILNKLICILEDESN